MTAEYQVVVQLLAALAIGLLIGIERGWSDREEDEGDRVAGLRTFSLIGLLGGVWAQLSVEIGDWVLAVAFIAVAALIIVSHIIETRETEDLGTTTEFAMMLTFSLAAWAALGFYTYALGATVFVVALLNLKPVLHRWLRNIETKEIYAGIKLLIISIVLLPLLPNQGYGPWQALNPYWIWWMVVLICGISFAGYFAIKYVGNKWGTLVTAVTGGLASSTAVTLSLAQFARQHTNKTLFMGGVFFASSIMFIRMLIEVSIVNSSLLTKLWLPTLLLFSGVLLAGAWFLRRQQPATSDPQLEIENPFNLSTALKFGAMLAVILVLSEAMKTRFGNEGVYILSVVSGLMDVDAITLSLSKLAHTDLSPDVATLGIIIASIMNTLVKGFLFAFFVGFKKSLKLIIGLLVAVIPGFIAAIFLI